MSITALVSEEEMRPDNSKRPMSTQQAAGYLKVSLATMKRWRTTGDGPRFGKLGRNVVYRQCDLDDYIESKLRLSTHEE